MAYDKQQAEKVCEAIAAGKTVREVAAMPGMPCKATIFNWLRENEEFQRMYEIATDERTDSDVDDMVRIADECKKDPDSIRKARLQIYARERRAQMMKPRKYGQKLELGGTGASGEIVVEILRHGATTKENA